ncbi:MAG: alpha/beta fold hydrolase [Flavobacteriales bacterium]|nr:alpha/beta fold hydrolase [Flavobacteriales bacterium]
MQHTLFLLHGFPHDRTLWDGNLGALSDTAKVIALDLPGFGNNTYHPTTTTMEAMALDVKEQLAQHGVERIVLCGLSMGGYVAMAFMEQWPELVSGAILCNTRSTADTEEAKAGRGTTAQDALEKGMTVIARGMLPKVLGATTRRERPALVAQVEALMARQSAEGVAAASRGMALRPDRTGILRAFTPPALVITGAEDALMPLPTSEAMASAFPNAQLVVLPAAGHLSNVEAPDAFNTAVSTYLRAL